MSLLALQHYIRCQSDTKRRTRWAKSLAANRIIMMVSKIIRPDVSFNGGINDQTERVKNRVMVIKVSESKFMFSSCLTNLLIKSVSG
uniref:Uncharacterized protein n=1 Tax=Caenorhabditis japonica TaxID=281687 RepID=A0A8R1IWR9_CAEJA